MSPTWMAILFGGIGLVTAWSLMREVNRGSVESDGVTYDADANPMGYPAALAGRGVVLALCVLEVAHSLGWGEDPFLALKNLLGPLD